MNIRQYLIQGYLLGCIGAALSMLLVYHCPPGGFGLGYYAIFALLYGNRFTTVLCLAIAEIQAIEKKNTESVLPKGWKAWINLGAGVGAFVGGVFFLYLLRSVWHSEALNFASSDDLANLPPLGAWVGSFIGAWVSSYYIGHSNKRRAIAVFVFVGVLAMTAWIPQANFAGTLFNKGRSSSALVHAASQNYVRQVIELSGRWWMSDEVRLSALRRAIQFGNIESVRALINSGVALNEAKWMSPLGLAAERGKLDIASILIDAGANVNYSPEYDQFPLTGAVRNSHRDIVELLIDNKADVNVAEKYGDTPVDQALRKAQQSSDNNDTIAILNMILEAGGKLNAVDTIKALSLDRVSSITYDSILNFRDTPDWQDNAGETMLMTAIRRQNDEALSQVLSLDVDVNITNKSGDAALHIAIDRDADNFVIEKLINAGANVNQMSKHLGMPIEIAIDRENLDIVEILQNTESFNGTNNHYLVSESALRKDLSRMQSLLLDEKNDVLLDAEISDRNRALNIAAKNGDINIAKLLLESGVDINPPVPTTPLISAISGKHYQMVDFLIERGANINGRQGAEYSPLVAAVRANDHSILNHLIQSGANIHATSSRSKRTALMEAMYALDSVDYSIVKTLLDAGANPIVKEGDEEYFLSALPYVSSREEADDVNRSIKHLRDSGLDIDSLVDKFGGTALSSAAKIGDVEAVRNLIALGADVNIGYEDDESPMSKALLNIHFSSSPLVEDKVSQSIVEILKEAGAKYPLWYRDGSGVNDSKRYS